MSNPTQYAIFLPNFKRFGDPETVLRLAVEAEAAGWDGVFLWDHINRSPEQGVVLDPWIVMGAIAAVTERVRIGPMITPLPRRRPHKVAQETATLDRLSKGRLILGVGLGSGRPEEWGKLGEEANPRVRGAMLDEGLEVITKLWRTEPVTHHGTHYTVDGVQFHGGPHQQPRVPIWVAGNWPNRPPMRRAARWDGAFPLTNHDREDSDARRTAFAEVADFVRVQRAEAGLTGPFDLVQTGATPGTDRAAARAILDPLVESGMTWWLEAIAPWPFGGTWEDDDWPLDAMRGRVLDGPPR